MPRRSGLRLRDGGVIDARADLASISAGCLFGCTLWGNDQVSIESTNNHLRYRCDIYAAMTLLLDWPRFTDWLAALGGLMLLPE